MTVNLFEFLKVFIIVFGVAGGITFFRKTFVEDNNNSETSETDKDFFTKNVMDYDGMGNFGRFPIKAKQERKR